MITRIEIDGFKSFVDFSLDLPPFLAVIGTNASGKSNLLDALRFLSEAVRRDLDAAVDAVRGDPEGLLRERGDGTRVDHMRFAVELLVDPLPGSSDAPTRWRYELALGWRSGRMDLPAMSVVDESLSPLAERDDRWLAVVQAAPRWASAHIGHGQPQSASTAEGAEPSGIAWGKGEGDGWFTRPADMEPVDRLVLGGGGRRFDGLVHGPIAWALTDIAVLELEDAALRRVSNLKGRTRLGADGRDLPGQLLALRASTATDDDPQGVLADIQADLARIVRGVSGFAVLEDPDRRDVRIEFEGRNEPRFGAEIASGGTLRTLGVLAALYSMMSFDKAESFSSFDVVAVEEPENGVFPEHLRELLATMRSMASDPAADEPERPLSQVLLTSHSPVVLDAVPRDQIVFLDTVTRVERGVASQVTRARRLLPAGEAPTPDDKGRVIAESELDRFRTGQRPPG